MTAWIDYDHHARTRPRGDFWGQVRRTVGGRPVGQDQIDMIVDTVRNRLGITGSDTLLDLACGNGALTELVDEGCVGSLGVDLSPYLVEVAAECFSSPRRRFEAADAADYVEQAQSPDRFTKALCYGSLAYMDDGTVIRMLGALHRRFPSISRVLLGNLPDPACAEAFYDGRAMPDLREPRSDIGRWRSPPQLAALAGPGWSASVSRMPPDFFGAHYRFDLLLERRP